MSVKEIVETAINDNKVTIFSKSYCPYCKKAKALFAKEFPDVETNVLELNERDDGRQIQDYLLTLTGQSTVPNIFVNRQHVGGSDAVQKSFDDGKLVSLVRAQVFRS